MKLMTRTGIYKAANVTFNPETKTATSYDWWVFVKPIGGKLVFNNYNYSNTTRKHQYKMRDLLNELGLRIDRFVVVKEGLQNLKSLRDLNLSENETLDALKENEELKRKARNEKARIRRATKKAQVLTITSEGA